MGSFVDEVTEPAVYLDDMSDDISDTIIYTRSFADEMRVLLTNTINDLSDIVGTYNPNIDEVLFDIDDISKPSYPLPPVLSTFVSDIYDTLLNKIRNDVISGGNGLTDAVYAAIIARKQEAERTNQDIKYREALDSVGGAGFNLPSGQIGALQRGITNELIAKDQDSINNVLIKDFDTATENTRFAVQMGIELEKILRTAWATVEDRKAALYTTQVEAISSEYRALVDWARAEIEVIKVKAEIAIKNGELGLSAYNSAVELAKDVSTAIANIASQSVASALGAINTSLSNSYSGSENRAEQFSHSESLSESHTFEEE